MYRYILVLLSFIAFRASAQVSIIQYPLQNMQLRPSDMFRADLLNADNKATQLYIIGTIANSQNGQKLVSAKSKIIDVNPGSTQISESLLMPEYTFFSSSLEQTGSLPYGNYTVCLKAYLVGGIEETATACEDIELMPLSPPLLLSPENQSTIQEEYPLLVWLPPMPVGKEKVVYDLKLVELAPNQTAYDAMQKNFAMLEQKNIRGTTLQYPANAMKLEIGKKYAWKIWALTGDRKPIGETEVWWFTRSDSRPADQAAAGNPFLQLKKNYDAEFIPVQGNVLRLMFYERYNKNDIRYQIYDGEMKPVDAKCSQLLTQKTPGDNMIVINLLDCDNLKKGIYTIEVANEKGEIFGAKFKYLY